MFLAQIVAPGIPDWAMLAGIVWLVCDKLFTVLKKRGVDLPLIAKSINQMTEDITGLKVDMSEVKTKTTRLDESHHGNFSKNEDGTYKWHNAKYITDKIRATDDEVSALKLQLNELHGLCTLIKEKLDSN